MRLFRLGAQALSVVLVAALLGLLVWKVAHQTGSSNVAAQVFTPKRAESYVNTPASAVFTRVADVLDECLAIFPKQAWEDLATKVRALPITDPGARSFQRYLFAGAFDVDLDRQGRVLVPLNLRQFAGLEGEAVVVGSLDHAEIWAPQRWDGYRKALEDPDVLARHLTGLGI